MNKYIEGLALFGIGFRQYIAWRYLDSMLCDLARMDTEPMPDVEV